MAAGYKQGRVAAAASMAHQIAGCIPALFLNCMLASFSSVIRVGHSPCLLFNSFAGEPTGKERAAGRISGVKQPAGRSSSGEPPTGRSAPWPRRPIVFLTNSDLSETLTFGGGNTLDATMTTYTISRPLGSVLPTACEKLKLVERACR